MTRARVQERQETTKSESRSKDKALPLSDTDIRAVFHTLHLDTDEARRRINRFPEWPPKPDPGWEIKWGADSQADGDVDPALRAP